MSYLDIKLQYFANNIKTVKAIGELTLYQWLYSIKHPKEEVMQLFKDIEQASKDGDLKLKSELKQQLFYLTPATVSDGLGRAYTNIQSFTGICSVDVDGLEEEYAKEFKEYLFETYPFIIACFLSPSRKGVKALVKIPVVNSVAEYKEYYFGLLAILDCYKNIDPAPSNSVLPHFISYDKELLYRTNATEFTERGYKIDECRVGEQSLEDLDINLEDAPKIKQMLKRMLAQIDVEQTAHLKIRSVGLLAGGYSVAGYFDYDEIKEWLFDLMDDVQYLHKSMRTYKRTLTDMMARGSLAPIEYDDER